ncbi:MAG: hypothetical protein D6725_10625 [Planctomycetota bacterium]|nr:MAG: hypothetical protein D6725_10625 [Planctomycetota bacterium]
MFPAITAAAKGQIRHCRKGNTLRSRESRPPVLCEARRIASPGHNNPTRVANAAAVAQKVAILKARSRRCKRRDRRDGIQETTADRSAPRANLENLRKIANSHRLQMAEKPHAFSPSKASIRHCSLQ